MVEDEAERIEASEDVARMVRVDRQQICWVLVDVDRLIEDDHPARAGWELVGRLDLTGFTSRIGSLEGGAGRPAYDPHLLISPWVYAYSCGTGSAREVARRCAHDPAFRWLTGLMAVSHRTLSGFRLAHGAALDDLFTQLLGLLSTAGLIALQTVTQDGTKVGADAGGASFRGKARIAAHLAAARRQVEAMGPSDDESLTARQRSARERAGRERLSRLEQALAEIERLQMSKPRGHAEASVSRIRSGRAPAIPRRGSCATRLVTTP